MEIQETATIRRILAATDFSENGAGAVDWAIELARAHAAELVLLFAAGAPEVLEHELGVEAAWPQVYPELRRVAEARLEAEVARAKENGVRARWVMEIGMPAPCILTAAKSEQSDLIVIGTRGHTGFKRLIIGSTAETVVQKAHCSVFVVHPSDSVLERAMWTILLSTDFSKDAEAALQIALQLPGRGHQAAHEAGGVRLILMHVSQPEPELYGLLPIDSEVRKEAMARYVKRDTTYLDEIAEELRDLGFIVEIVVRSGGDAAELILEEALAANVDFIAIGSHGHSKLARMILGSVADRVVRYAPCPVLSVRSTTLA